MKITAVLLLLLFSLLQAGPGIVSFFSDEPALVLIDEEKAKDGAESEKKIKKDFSAYTLPLVLDSRQPGSVLHNSEQLHPSPFLEQHTPPPNKG